MYDDFVHRYYLFVDNYIPFLQNASHRCLIFNFQCSGLCSYLFLCSCFPKGLFTCMGHHLQTLAFVSFYGPLVALRIPSRESHLTQGQFIKHLSLGSHVSMWVVAHTHISLLFCTFTIFTCFWLHSVHHTTLGTHAQSQDCGWSCWGQAEQWPAHPY